MWNCRISTLFKALAPKSAFLKLSTICILAKCSAFWFIQCIFWFVKPSFSGFVFCWISMKFSLFRTIYDARKPVDWMMICTEKVYIIFLLNSHENGTENTWSQPHVRTRASRWGAIAYPHASAIAYFPAHQNSKCTPPVLIHRAITYDSFMVLAKKKPKRSWVTIKEKDPESYCLTSGDPQTCPQGKMFAPLYSALHYLRFDTQHDYVCTKWILTHRGHTPLALPPGVTSKFWMCSSSLHP